MDLQEDLQPQTESKTIRNMQGGLSHEYGAALRYLSHYFLIPPERYKMNYFGVDTDVREVLMAFAVHEMRHAEMLARMLTARGFTPNRLQNPFPQAKTMADVVAHNREGEEAVIAEFGRCLEEADDPEAEILFKLLLEDEISHRDVVLEMEEALAKDGLLQDRLLEAQAGEGEGILTLTFDLAFQYMYQSFLTGDDPLLGPRMRSMAITEMRHYRELGDWMARQGHPPVIDRQKGELGSEASSFIDDLHRHMAKERQLIEAYDGAQGLPPEIRNRIRKEREHWVDLSRYSDLFQGEKPLIH